MNNLIQETQLPEIIDQRGSLSFLESNNHIPFNIKGISIISNEFYFKEMIKYKKKDMFLVVLSGSVSIKVFSEKIDKIYTLNKPNTGLYISKSVKKDFIKYSLNSILLVLKSD